jgi:tetratricopeptide (TPR) repeat protein
MKNLFALALAVLVCSSASFSQEALEIRDVEIDSQSPEGAVLTQAGIAEEEGERIAILEGFLNDFPESTYLGYVLLQLQGLYTQQQNWSQAAVAGERLLQYVPTDLEVQHNHNQALLNSQQWPALREAVAATKPLADKEAAAPPPEDPTEDEEMIYESGLDYAKGVIQYTEWAINVGISQSPPAQQVQFMDTLKELYPESPYLAGIDDRYVIAYQQAGDVAGMVAAMEQALSNSPGNEQYIYALAEIALGRQDQETANARSEQLIKLMEEKPVPEGTSEEDWEATKKRFTALGHYVMGTGHFQKGDWRTSRRHLLQTVDSIKAEGGERYGILSYMLGFCYVKLDIAGDNIRQATYWMSEAAKVPNPMQAQAAQTLAAIKAAE